MSALTNAVRSIEESGRRALFTLLIGLSPRVRRPAPGALRGKPLRVLFIMEDALGDMVLTMPALRAIAESHPGTVVDVVTWAGSGELLRHAPYVRRVILFPRRDHRRLHAAMMVFRAGAYDVVVDGMVLSGHVRSRNLAMMLASGARYWIGETGRGSSYLLNVTTSRPPAATPHLERMLALAAPFGAARDAKRPMISMTDDERDAAAATWDTLGSGSRILINVSTNGVERQWSASKFSDVVAHLRHRAPFAGLIVVAMERDRHRAEAAAGDNATVIVPTIRELLALVESADLVVSPDTAVCHAASAFCRPLVSIHNAHKEQWLPFDTPGVRVVGPSSENLDDVTADMVCRGIDDVLDGVLPAAHHPAISSVAV